MVLTGGLMYFYPKIKSSAVLSPICVCESSRRIEHFKQVPIQVCLKVYGNTSASMLKELSLVGVFARLCFEL